MRGFPEDVKRFVHEHINSVEQLEALLLLRSEPRPWSAEDVSRRLFSSPPSAATRLADLKARGLVLEECQGEAQSKAEGSASLYRYQPRSASEEATIASLDTLYRTRKDAVIALIFSRPDPLQSFADAFRLRPDGADDGANNGRRG